MALTIPNVALQSEKAGFDTTALTSNSLQYDRSVLATKTFASLIALGDSIQLRRDSVEASKVVSDLKYEAAMRQQKFLTENANPTQQDLDNLNNDFSAYATKVKGEKLANIDPRAMVRFEDEVRGISDNLLINSGKGFIQKRHDVETKEIAGIISESMDDCARFYGYDDAAYKKANVRLLDSVKALGEHRGLVGEALDDFVKENVSKSLYNTGLVAHSEKRFNQLAKIVRTQRDTMRMDDWYKLNNLLTSEIERQAAKSAVKDNDILNYHLMKEECAKLMLNDAEWRKSQAERGLITEDALRKEANKQSILQVQNELAQYKRNNDISYVKLQDIVSTFKAFTKNSGFTEQTDPELRLGYLIDCANPSATDAEKQQLLVEIKGNKFYDEVMNKLLVPDSEYDSTRESKLAIERLKSSPQERAALGAMSPANRLNYYRQRGISAAGQNEIETVISTEKIQSANTKSINEINGVIRLSFNKAGHSIRLDKNEFLKEVIPEGVSTSSPNYKKFMQLGQKKVYEKIFSLVSSDKNLVEVNDVASYLKNNPDYLLDSKTGKMKSEVMDILDETKKEIELEYGPFGSSRNITYLEERYN